MVVNNTDADADDADDTDSDAVATTTTNSFNFNDLFLTNFDASSRVEDFDKEIQSESNKLKCQSENRLRPGDAQNHSQASAGFIAN